MVIQHVALKTEIHRRSQWREGVGGCISRTRRFCLAVAYWCFHTGHMLPNKLPNLLLNLLSNMWLVWKHFFVRLFCDSHISEMRARYHSNGGPLRLCAESKKTLNLTDPSQWRLDHLTNVQPRVIWPLLSYWSARTRPVDSYTGLEADKWQS